MNNFNKKILIVEDEILLAMDIELSLKEMGHSVVGCVVTGEEALSVIEKDKPDLVLIDIKLDRSMDGIETSKQIRHRHNIPIVFITGNADQDTLKRANELNPIDLIIKPITDQRLSSILQKAFL
jgi:CheY-like chemotaxis protein